MTTFQYLRQHPQLEPVPGERASRRRLRDNSGATGHSHWPPRRMNGPLIVLVTPITLLPACHHERDQDIGRLIRASAEPGTGQSAIVTPNSPCRTLAVQLCGRSRAALADRQVRTSRQPNLFSEHPPPRRRDGQETTGAADRGSLFGHGPDDKRVTPEVVAWTVRLCAGRTCCRPRR